ncbi:MAG: P1 family peptidase [Clostridiales bacterium]|nr:P1 family peptidase [Clostridiales bacterium]
MFNGAITDVAGILVGHSTNSAAKTGCTAILAPDGAVGGVDVRGGAPGTRESDAFAEGAMVPLVHAVTLCGGSAFGLAAAQGVMDYLEEQGIGFDVGVAKVPLVGAAVIFDLGVGDAKVRPTAADGYAAAAAACKDDRSMGLVGAGTGATVGKLFGPAMAEAGGLGTASMKVGKATVGCIVAVNACGNIHDHTTGSIIAGSYNASLGVRHSVTDLLAFAGESGKNTTICCIATDAKLNKHEAHRLAMLAHDGYAMAIRPVHMLNDGDTAFSLCTGKVEEDANLIFAAAAEVTARAICNAIYAGGAK